MPITRVVVHPHLHEQYAHGNALRNSIVSRMPVINDQVELSRVDAVNSGLLLLS